MGGGGGSSLADGSQSSRLSDSSFSDSTSGGQRGSCSEGESGASVSEQAFLVGLELPNQGCPEHDQNPQPDETKYGEKALQRCCPSDSAS